MKLSSPRAVALVLPSAAAPASVDCQLPLPEEQRCIGLMKETAGISTIISIANAEHRMSATFAEQSLHSLHPHCHRSETVNLCRRRRPIFSRCLVLLIAIIPFAVLSLAQLKGSSSDEEAPSSPSRCHHRPTKPFRPSRRLVYGVATVFSLHDQCPPLAVRQLAHDPDADGEEQGRVPWPELLASVVPAVLLDDCQEQDGLGTTREDEDHLDTMMVHLDVRAGQP
jgi:hypothetical protein